MSRADILVKLITISFVIFSHPVAAPVLQQKQPGAAVLINSGDSVQIGCIGCVLTPPNNPTVFIDCTPESGEDPFYQWFVQFNETDELLLEGETSAMLSVTEEGTYICRVGNVDNPPQETATTIIGCKLICNPLEGGIQLGYFSSLIPITGFHPG